ncbi:MAG: hypothetical protein VKL39_24945, partial [Leptolyngbyaceae bacterium]|nr:hypothetical protein [Leptolyngbyaceae bacterium]
MNYFTHALPHLDRPYFVAGTALPDWLSVVNRKVRLRPKLLEPHDTRDQTMTAELVAGTLRHFDDDDWFHRTRGFAEVSAEVGLLFRRGLAGSDGFRCGFLGHIVTEMLLDAVLISRYPAKYDVYCSILPEVDAQGVAQQVEEIAGKPIPQLAEFIGLFARERILNAYVHDTGLLRRLNQVLSRVKLTPLPPMA